MSEDGVTLLDNGVIVHTGWTSEAMKIYKINGWYYLFYSESPGDEGRIRSQYAARSRSIYGPYQICKLVHSHGRPDQGPNQGGLVEDVDGNWWFLCHGMSRAPLSANGRQLMLLPVYWTDGWPMIGEDLDNDGVGEMIWQHKKPYSAETVTPHLPAAGDEFDQPELGLQWSWNHKDRPDRWSLTERPGYLRLKACRPVGNGGFYRACNTLTQRLMGETGTIDTVLDTSGMIDGQYAGMCLLAAPSYLLGVYQKNGKKVIRWQNTLYRLSKDVQSVAYDDDFYQKDICEVPADCGLVYFRMKIRGEKACLYYSLDGKKYTAAEDWLRFAFFAWRGGRPGVFSYNELEEGGIADFDYFRYAVDDETANIKGSVWTE
jgi:beta-xylosidase